MTLQLYDETVRRPSWRYWLTLLGLMGVGGLAVVGAGSYLFPSETVTIASLDAIPQQVVRPLTVSADAPPSTTTGVSSSAAALTTAQDATRGFQVAHPASWTVWSADGVALLRSDPCGTSTVVFYPVELTNKTVTADVFLKAVSGVVAARVAAHSGKLSLGTVDASRDGSATALLSGTACGNAVEGSVQATVQGSQALFKLDWFPSSEKSQLTNTLTSMLQSYKTTQASMLNFAGTRIGLATPSDWTVTEAKDMTTATSANASVTASTVNFSASGSLDSAFADWLKVQRDAGNALSDWANDADASLSLDDAAGRHWNTKTQFVHYTKDGQTYRGALTASYTDALSNTAWVLWRTAPDTDWASKTSLLTAVEQSATLYAASAHLPAATARLSLPTVASAPNDQLLLGSEVRQALLGAAAGRFKSKIDSFQPLVAPNGARFFASLNGRSLATGTFTTSLSGQTVTLTPESETTK